MVEISGFEGRVKRAGDEVERLIAEQIGVVSATMPSSRAPHQIVLHTTEEVDFSLLPRRIEGFDVCTDRDEDEIDQPRLWVVASNGWRRPRYDPTHPLFQKRG